MLALLGAVAAGCAGRGTPVGRTDVAKMPSPADDRREAPRPAAAETDPSPDPSSKIGLDLSRLDADGLRGPPGGKVAVDYEFSIPDTPENRRAVQRIDPAVRFMPGSRGRIGAGPGECVCLGSTHRSDFRDVLVELARLPFVTRIVECHHE